MRRRFEDMPETLDPRLESVDRLLALAARRALDLAPRALNERVVRASSDLLPRPRLTLAGTTSRERAGGWSFVFSRRVALAACMACLFLGGILTLRTQPGSPPVAGGELIVVTPESEESLSAFLAPIGDDELADDRARTSILELGDTEFWAVEAELRALESALEVQ